MNTLFKYIIASTIVITSSLFAGPPQERLVLHLDASVEDSIKLDGNGRVVGWIDQSKAHNDAVTTSSHAPEWIDGALNDSPVIRFSGNQWFDLPILSDTATGYSVFFVFQRNESQTSDEEWQRLISSTSTQYPKDTKEPAFHLGLGKRVGAMEPQILYDLFRSDLHAPMTLGAGHTGHNHPLMGDIAEVLVYDHSFLVYEQIAEVQNYLRKKWDITEKPKGDWTHKGPLPKPLPQSFDDELPLSDQDDVGGWTKLEALSDEFNGDTLDLEKWFDHNPAWYGRAPSRYLARNVKVSDGYLQIVMSKDTSLPVEQFYGGSEYQDYVAASVVGKEPVNYGYFEIRAKPMASAGSSAWWFTGKSFDREKDKEQRLEIDVFEIGGKAIGKEYSYNMNLHDFKTKDNPRHYSLGDTWKTNEPLIDRFWVFGLEWTPEVINYYVDGVLVRRVDNDRWHGPQYMIFDTETMLDWLGIPEDEDLPSTFMVDYVRSWKNAETENDWRERYDSKERMYNTGATRYVRSMDP